MLLSIQIKYAVWSLTFPSNQRFLRYGFYRRGLVETRRREWWLRWTPCGSGLLHGFKRTLNPISAASPNIHSLSGTAYRNEPLWRLSHRRSVSLKADRAQARARIASAWFAMVPVRWLLNDRLWMGVTLLVLKETAIMSNFFPRLTCQ